MKMMTKIVLAVLAAYSAILLIPTSVKGSSECEKKCKNPSFKDLTYFDGADILKPSEMLQRFEAKRKDWVENTLKKNYGNDTYLNVFEPKEFVFDDTTTSKRTSVGRNMLWKDPKLLAKDRKPTGPPGPAWDRLVRKWLIKLLQIRLNILEERLHVKPICLDECAKKEGGGGDSRFLRNENNSNNNGLYSKFTWATGGHSASAGHGNMFHESYTARMGEAIAPIFQEIGLDFVAKNYAMGGTASADEIALCYNSVFGRDVDFFSWDYGMTDGRAPWKMIMYVYHAAGLSKIADSVSQPGNVRYRPAFFTLHSQKAEFVPKVFQDLGLTTMDWDYAYFQKIINKIPNTFGKSDAEIDQMPPYIQYFICGGRLEDGEPGCKEHKYNTTICANRKFKAGWHPGWKEHALNGNLLAMVHLDAAEDALKKMVVMETTETKESETLEDMKRRLEQKLQALDQEEQKDYDNIFASPIPEPFKRQLEVGWQDNDRHTHLTDVDMEVFYKETAFCHTAILPAEIRFQGFLTENFTTTGTIFDQNYESSWKYPISKESEVMEQETRKEGAVEYKDPRAGRNGQLVLVAAHEDRQVCDEPTNLDYKDYFFMSSLQGQKSLILPNKSEKKHYTEFDASKSKGYVLACLKKCLWGNCGEGDMHDYFGWRRRPKKNQVLPSDQEIKRKYGTLEIRINGELVTEASDMQQCYVLKNANGPVWKPNADGQYEITMKSNAGTNYAYWRFSSFVFL